MSTTSIHFRSTTPPQVNPRPVQMLSALRTRSTYGPDDPQLEFAVKALSGPHWSGPRASEFQAKQRGGGIAARYDAAQYSDDTRKHWAMADALGPDGAAMPGVRYLLRIRSRYEIANNSYARGIVTTLANDTIGTGPRLHVTTEDDVLNTAVKREFQKWAKEIDLAGKLRTMRCAKTSDGEAFAIQTNRNLPEDHYARGGSPVKLGVRIIEADQCASVAAQNFAVPAVDGIELDEYWNPKAYHVLKVHPGNYAYLPGYIGFPWDYDTFPATQVCHWFRKDRPEQHRGIPELTPALNLFAQLRDYTASVLKSARIQSAWSIAVQTDAPAGTEAANVAPMDTFEFEDGMALTMPYGWEAKGLNPTQPGALYPDFKRELLCEIGRCLHMPFCVVAGDSSRYNYASGRLDHQLYRKAIDVDRADCELSILDKIFRWWLDEAVLIEGYLPQRARMMAELPHQWFWPGWEHVDPGKEATAQATRLANHTTTLATEYARVGLEWESSIRQRAKELALMEELGVPPVMQAPGSQQQQQDEDIVPNAEETEAI